MGNRSIASHDVFGVSRQVEVFEENYSYTLVANALAPWVTRSLAGMALTVSDKWFNVYLNAFCNGYAISVSKNSKNCKYHVVFSKQNQSAND